MKYIKDKSGTIVLAFDGETLYYRTQEESISDLELDESLSIQHLALENNGSLKLAVILDLLEDLGIITDIDFIKNSIKKNIPILAKLLFDHEIAVSSDKDRIVLIEKESDGPLISHKDILYLDVNSFDLYISRKSYHSASEIIEYYGLENNEYWDQIQSNGEFIEGEYLDIENAGDLLEGIKTLLSSNDSCGILFDEINFWEIIEKLSKYKVTRKLSTELQSYFIRI